MVQRRGVKKQFDVCRVRPGAVRAISAAGGDHAGWTDDCGWRAAAAGCGPRLPVLEGPAGSWSRPSNPVPQLRVGACMIERFSDFIQVFTFF